MSRVMEGKQVQLGCSSRLLTYALPVLPSIIEEKVVDAAVEDIVAVNLRVRNEIYIRVWIDDERSGIEGVGCWERLWGAEARRPTVTGVSRQDKPGFNDKTLSEDTDRKTFNSGFWGFWGIGPIKNRKATKTCTDSPYGTKFVPKLYRETVIPVYSQRRRTHSAPALRRFISRMMRPCKAER